jgi:multiple sugar transport system permease protein
MTIRKGFYHLIMHAVLLAGAIFSILPFFWMISTSLKTPDEVNQSTIQWLPSVPQWSNYPEAMRRASTIGVPFERCFANSAIIALAVTAGVLITAILAAYAFSIKTFKGKAFIFLLFLSAMMIPFEVTLIPNFITIQKLGWYDTYAALIVPWTANVFSIFFLRRIFERMPREVYDAARVDGCGDIRFLWSIGIPMVRPAMITIGLYTFLGSWNAFLWPLVVTGRPELSVIQKGLSNFIQEAGTEYQLLMAAATLTIIPVVLIYFFAQKWFQEGAEGIG